MLPFALAHPLWWVARRSARFLSVLAFVVALGAGGHAVVPSPPSVSASSVAASVGAAPLEPLAITTVRGVSAPPTLGAVRIGSGSDDADGTVHLDRTAVHEPAVRIAPPHRSPVSAPGVTTEPTGTLRSAPLGQRAPPRD